MNTNVPADFESLSDSELLKLVVEDYNLTQALLSANPYLAQETSFRLFDGEWVRVYWKQLLTEITSMPLTEAALGVILEEPIKELAAKITAHYNLSSAAAMGAFALAILIIRAASTSLKKSSNEKGTHTGKKEKSRDKKSVSKKKHNKKKDKKEKPDKKKGKKKSKK